MDRARMIRLELGQDEKLSPDEMAAGWHFCPEWDFMLIQMGHGEGEQCDCKPWTQTEIAATTGA